MIEMSQLKQARINANLSIEEVSKKLNIRKHYIAALEENRLSEIPSPVYVKGYMKMYAGLLGIELDPIDLNFTKDECSKKITHAFSKAKLGIAVLMSFSLVTGLWFYMVSLPHINETDVVDHLENLEPANYLLNIQKQKNEAQDLEEVIEPTAPTNGKLNDIDE